VAEHFALPEAALVGGSREKVVCAARAVAMHLVRQHTQMSYPEIGRALGRKNHSTVIAACQRVEALIAGGELLCWNTPTGARHQAIADILHDLEAAVRRTK
jgi:chromosomal replication initiator protein